MATKRRITVRVQPPKEVEVEERLKPVKLRQDHGWKDWFLRDYSRYWFVVACLMGDAFIVLWVGQSVDPSLSISVPLIVLAMLALMEYLAYQRLWGKDGRWRRG
jgi:hypothetical protein